MLIVLIFAAIGIIPAVSACFAKNKGGRAALSVFSFLGFFVLSVLLSAFMLPSYIGVHVTWIPFVLFGAVFAIIMLIAWQPFGKKTLRIIIWSVACIAVIVPAAFAIPKIYQNSLTIRMSDEVNLWQYMPFGNFSYNNGVWTRHDSFVAILNEEPSLRLGGELPRLDGATALYPLYSAFTQATYPMPEPALDTEYSPYRDLRYEDNEIDPLVVCSRTSIAFENILDGYADIAFLMGVSDNQRAAANEKGLELVLVPIGREAFVFFVHSRNTVNDISSADIRRIYSGELTNWAEAGGKNNNIRAYQRPEASGSQVMLRQIMGDAPIIPAPDEDVFDMMMGMVRRVANYRNYRNSLGYSFLYYARDMVADHNIKFLSINGIEPTDQNIASGAYPFANDFYAVTVKRGGEYLNPERFENIDKLLEWITSHQGQYLVEATGYVSVN